MQSKKLNIFFLLLLATPALAVKLSARDGQELEAEQDLEVGGSPMARVVQLMKDLGDKLSKEAEDEQAAYDKFVCWAKQTLDQKTASNAKATERIASLTTYIADIDSGKVWFTGQKDQMEKILVQCLATSATSARPTTQLILCKRRPSAARRMRFLGPQ